MYDWFIHFVTAVRRWRDRMSGTFNMDEMFRTCGVCGKEVSIRGTYKYKRLVKGKTVYYCGWNCYNKGQKK